MNMTRRHPLILALALLCGATAPAFATSPAMTEKPSTALRLATYNTSLYSDDAGGLIKELEGSIPKGQLSALSMGIPPPPPPPAATRTSPPKEIEQAGPSRGPVAVERPYDPSDPDPVDTGIGSAGSGAESPPITEDPSEFEWRNLKKLVVLVLSSLVWKCPEVQDQIRRHGGLETILCCTNFDAHNPYIKEHAVMCLKFLLEGNKENQRMVEQLEAREVVKDDGGMLERSGFEAVIDKTGKLAIRPRGS